MDEILERFADLLADKVAERMSGVNASASPGKLITRKEAADLLNITECTLWRWSKEGILHPHKVGGRVYYDKKELLDDTISLRQ